MRLKTYSELRSTTRKSWLRIGFCCARRREDKGLPAPKLPDIQDFALLPSALVGHPMLNDLSQDEDGVGSPYPIIDIYGTKEEAMKYIKKRGDMYTEPPVSLVSKAWEKQASELGVKHEDQ
jgi:hypothetical protein